MRGRRSGEFPAEGDVDDGADEDGVDPSLLSSRVLDLESMMTASVVSVTEGWTSVPSMCRDVVDVNGGEDAVGNGFSAEGEVDDTDGEDGVDPSSLSSREVDLELISAAAVMEDSAASVESVSATMLREIATSSADVVGGNGGEDAVGDSPEVVEGDLVGEEGVRRRTQAS